MHPFFFASRRTACALFLAALCSRPLAPAVAAAAAETPIDSPSDPVAAMEALMASTFPADAPGVAILVARDRRVILRRGYGMADLELGVPMDATRVFPICSVTKQFTAVAILQLVEAGKLGLDDNIQKYLPDYPARGATITVAQLLNHTAGIPDVDLQRPEWKRRWAEAVPAEEFIAATKDQPLDFAPGAGWKYSNNGYALLGRIVEVVSGERYADYVRSHLFAPAGMEHSRYSETQPIVPGRVPGYSRRQKNWVNAPRFDLSSAYAAGGLLSTVDDLWAWEQALEAGKLVRADLLARARTEVSLPDGRGSHYGFGWEVQRLGDQRMICHGGGVPGYSAFELSVPETGLYIVAFANTESPSMPLRGLAVRLAKIALGLSSNPAAAASAAPLEDYIGDYRVGPGVAFKVTLKNGILHAQLGPGTRPLMATARDEFATGKDGMSFRFERDRAQRVTKVLVATDGPGPEQVWWKEQAVNAP